MAELIIQSGKHQGRRLRFPDTEITIGRGDECQVRLTSADVSKEHCRLRATGEGLIVEDLGSSNGTFVNDVRIEGPTRLAPGDRLRVGPMVFEVPAAARKQAAAKRTGRKSDPLSEDDIANWLTDETDHGEAASADTTVISTTAPAAPVAANAAAETSALTAAVAAAESGPRDERKKARTIADEAADIIRRWWDVHKDE
ncbi:MAG TPA: FHA domain-containing protein [Planctomycetaceae bacterium]|nr:FHA domain-containing protein [Planctomycetaceae bacterium]